MSYFSMLRINFLFFILIFLSEMRVIHNFTLDQNSIENGVTWKFDNFYLFGKDLHLYLNSKDLFNVDKSYRFEGMKVCFWAAFYTELQVKQMEKQFSIIFTGNFTEGNIAVIHSLVIWSDGSLQIIFTDNRRSITAATQNETIRFDCLYYYICYSIKITKGSIFDRRNHFELTLFDRKIKLKVRLEKPYFFSNPLGSSIGSDSHTGFLYWALFSMNVWDSFDEEKSKLEVCNTKPCHLEEICLPLPGENSRKCLCPPGTSGKSCHTNFPFCYNGGTYITFNNSNHCICSYDYTGVQCEVQRANRSFQVSTDSQILFIEETATIVINSNFTLEHPVNVKWYLAQGTILEYLDIENCSSCSKRIHGLNEFTHVWLQNQSDWKCNIIFTTEGIHYINIEVKEVSFRANLSFAVSQRIREMILKTKSHFGRIGHEVELLLGVSNLGNMPEFIWNINQSEFYSDLPEPIDDDNDELSEFFPEQIPPNITKYVKQKWIFEEAGCFNINVTAKITGRTDTSVVATICIILESDMYKFYINSTITEVDGALSLLLMAVEDKTDTEYIFMVDKENVSVQYHLQKSDTYENLPTQYKMLTNIFFYANVTVVFDRTEISSVGIIISHRNTIIYEKIIEIVVVNKLCKPSVNILNVGLSQQTPTVYFRKDPIILRSITKFNCHDKVYPQWEWKLFDSSLKTEFNIKEVSNLSYLSFPERSLPYGIYAVKLVVKVFQMSKIISSENIRWFSINQSKPIAKILGGIERVISIDDELILDGSSSYDPDFSDADMNFTWICLIGECYFDSVTGRKKVIVIPKDQLKLMKYVFGLTVSHLNRQSLPFHQEIEVREGHLPILYVKCLSNCRTSVNPSEKFALKVSCSHCGYKPQYLWKMAPNKGNKKSFIDWDNETLYGNSSALLLIFSNVLQEGDSYLFTVTTGGENGGQAQYKVDVYKKPRVEKCTIKPKKGISLETQFTIECFGVHDENMPINYQLFFDNKLHYDRFLLRTSTYPKMADTILPIGNENDNYKAYISIIITNDVGMHTEVNLVVQVLPPHSSLTTIRDWLDDDKLERFMSTGDNEEAVVILESLSQVLKNNSEELHYRNELINMLDKLPLINMFGVKQSSHALYAMSQTDEQFSDDSKVKLTEFIRKAVQSFSKFSETQYFCSEEKFDTAKSIFLGSSGVLGAIIGKKNNNFYDGITYYQDTDYYNYRPSSEINCALGSKIINFIENVSDVLMWEIITNDNYTKISSELFDVFLQRYDEENYTEHNLGNIIKISEDIFGEDTKIRMIINNINPFICDDNSPLINTKTLILNVKHEKKAKNVKVESLLKRKEFSKNTQNGKAEVRLYNNRTACNVIISTHRTIIPNDNFTLQLSLTLYTQKTSFMITVSTQKPTIDDFSKWHYIISYSEQNKYYLTIPENLTTEGGTYFVGVLPYSALTIRALNLNINAKSRLEDVVTIEYSLDIFITKCFSYNKAWSGEGCHVGNSSTDRSLHCRCSHLSVFSGSYFVVPNTVDITQTIVLLGTVSKNPVVLICLVVIWIIYLMLLFWAGRTDKKNAKRTIKILSDNAESNCYYAVLISTGFRKDSGTTSRVYMQLEGINGKSRIFQMNDTEEEFFKSGSEDRFIIRTQSDIGQIMRLHVWHNNSGLKPSWFLDKIEIQDLASEQTMFFPGRWFAVDKADGKIYAILEPTDLKKYKVLFMRAISSQFREHHIWFSLFYSSPNSNFTRSQRLACILNILLASMLANIMFYGIDVTDPQDQLEIRYFKFSISEMIIGIQSCIIAFFVGIFMAAIFRNIRREKIPVIMGFSQIKYPKIFYRKESIASLKITETLPFLRKQLPSWFSYVAWFITIVSSVIYTYFILLYGLTYGYKRSISWLISMLTSLCTSIFILQPGKAMIFSIIIAYILAKKSKKLIVNSEKIKESQSEIPQGYISQNELHHYRHLKNRESKILFILSDSFMFICFTIAIQILVHNNRNHMAYFSNRAIKHIFISGAYGGRPFIDVTTLQHLKEYLNSTLLYGMHKEEWYNGEKFENGYTADGLTLLIEVARLRQVRIKPAICMEQILPLRSFCLPEYSLYAEDNNNYKSGWIRGMAVPSQTKKPTPWMYQTAKETKASKKYGELNVYSGGGYTALLGRKRKTSEKKLRRLLSRNWIDTKTRALFVDITTYNGNINVFTSISLTFEISGLGNVIPTYHIVTSNLDILIQVTNFQAGISEICCFLLILIFTYREIKNLYKLKTKYFKKYWNIFEFIFLFFGYFFIGITIKQSLGISGIWNRREEFQHVSFETAAKWDKIFLILQSIMVTLTTLKLWKILSFIQTFKLPYRTLKIAFKSIGHFTFMLILLMMSIMNFCVISFGGWVKHMRNLLQTMYSLMNYSLGEFEIDELTKTDQFFGPLFIFIFVIVVSWLFLTLIISILIDSFHTTIILKKQEKPRLEVANYVHHQLNILFRKTSTSWIEKTHKKWLNQQDETKYNN